MKSLTIQSIFLYVLMSGQGAMSAFVADPNLVKDDPNTKGFMAASRTETNTISGPYAKPLSGTLGMNWLNQGTKPPQPLVGQSNITFRIEQYPWPYIGYFWDHGYYGHDSFAGPWFYNPWYRYGYWQYYSNDYWRHHSHHHDGGWYNNAYTYPINYVEMQMKLNENTSFHLGVSFTSDPLYEYP